MYAKNTGSHNVVHEGRVVELFISYKGETEGDNPEDLSPGKLSLLGSGTQVQMLMLWKKISI